MIQVDDSELSPTHVVVLLSEDGKEDRWGPMPKRLAELTKQALDKYAEAPWYRSSRIVEN